MSSRYVLAAALALVPSTAGAATIIKDPHPPQYKLEIEPHANAQFLFKDAYGAFGIGPGIRLGIPIMSPGFIKSINDSVAINFGGDLLYTRPHGTCSGNGCPSGDPFWALYAPVTLQWNFWLTEKWSVFGEPGVVFGTPFGECERVYGCRRDRFAWPAFFAGARYHFSDTMALTMRAGYPTGLSVGLSIF